MDNTDLNTSLNTSLNDIFKDLKDISNKGNIILPKEFVRKFLLMNILIMNENTSIDQKEIFNYMKDNGFELPSIWQKLDTNKKDKYLETVNELISILK